MSDPLRSDHLPEPGEVPERDRDARIEGLLLAGLDHYFVGQHELAISVWTRVLFLDRGHARAKAYIDRARSAIAERQREGDELLHTGAAAVDRGDAGAARRLLTSAVERGASEEALVLLDRVNRLEHAVAGPSHLIASRPLSEATNHASDATTEGSGTSRAVWIATGVLGGLAAAGVVAWIALSRPDWLPVRSASTQSPPVQAVEPLPIPISSEAWLARARNLYEHGRLRDALTALEAIGHSDASRADADELKAAIQQKLLETARVRPVPPAVPAGAPAPQQAPAAPR